MKNYIQEGNIVTIIAPVGGVVSGQGLLIGNLFGVITKDAAEGESVEMAVEGVFNLPKASAAVLGQCARVSWDADNSLVVAPASGMPPIGTILIAAGNAITTARVRLDGISTAEAA